MANGQPQTQARPEPERQESGWSGLWRFFEYIGWRGEMDKGPPGTVTTIVEPFLIGRGWRGAPVFTNSFQSRFYRLIGIYPEMRKNTPGNEVGTLVEPRRGERHRGPPAMMYGNFPEQASEQTAPQPRQPSLPRYALESYTTTSTDHPVYVGRFGFRDDNFSRMIRDERNGSGYRWLH